MVFCLTSPVKLRQQVPDWLRAAAAHDVRGQAAVRRGGTVLTRQRTKQPKHQGEEQRSSESVEPHRQPRERAGFLADLKRPRGADAVGGNADRETAYAVVRDPQKIEHVFRQRRAEDAGGHNQHRGQRRQPADLLDDAHRDRRRHRLRRDRNQRGPARTEQPGDAHGRYDRRHRTDQQRAQQRHERAFEFVELRVQRNRQRDRRRPQQEMHELRTVEISRVRRVGQRQDQD